MSNTNGAHDTAGPLAVPMGTDGDHPHYPAGWAAPERERLAREIEAELSADARARVETEAQVTTEEAG